MTQYILRRILLAVPVILGILLVTFVLARVIPGDPCRAVLGERATDELCDAFFKRTGLDQPIPVQFVYYLKQIIIDQDFGESLRFGRPVSQIMIERLPVTLELAFTSILIASVLGLILGIISAYWHNSSIDVLTMIGANLGVSMPVFWLGLMLQYIFALQLKDTFLQLPPSGRLSPGVITIPFYETWGWALDEGTWFYILCFFIGKLNLLNSVITADWDVFWDAVTHLLLPAFAVATIPMAIVARITRSSLLEVLNLDYIRTARAKGLSEYRMIFRHALSNALLPVVTILGLQLGASLSGAVLTETIFNLAGLGRTLFEAITARDYVIVQGFTLVIAVFYVTINLIVDISYAFLDPRIRLS